MLTYLKFVVVPASVAYATWRVLPLLGGLI